MKRRCLPRLIAHSEAWFAFRFHHWVCVVAGACFYSVQLLPHWIPSLPYSLPGFLYLLAAVAVTGVFAFSLTVAFLLSQCRSRSEPFRNASWQWSLTCAMVLAIAIGLLVFNIALRRDLPVGSFVQRFDAELWKDPTSRNFIPGDITPRQKMLGDAIHSVVKCGNRETIIAALGEREDDYFTASGRDLIYRLGDERESFFRIDSEWLMIWFDDAERVSRYDVWTD